jgi:putative flippase GtrA
MKNPCQMIAALKKNQENEKFNSLIQFIFFGLVGLSNTFISYSIYVFFVFFNVHYLIGNIVAFVVSVLNSFYWNNKYVFKSKEGKRVAILGSLGRTFVAYGMTGIVMNSIMLYLMVDQLKFSKYLAPLVVLIITIPVNFILNKKWAFKN